MTWLARTPIAVVNAMVEMLPVLQAEESLSRCSETAVGSGTAGKDAKKTINAWKKIADRGGDKASRPKATPTMLGAVGVGYRVVKKGK